jgi:uncharacterized protein (DUF952 family)
MRIFKICLAEEWRAAEAAGVFRGSPLDRADGFIHFSTEDQVTGTLSRYFLDAGDLVLVAVDTDALGAALKFEPSRGGALFPHLYMDLPLDKVAWVKPIDRRADGNFRIPGE